MKMKRRIFTALFIAFVTCFSAVTFAGCWYIPVKYGNKKMEKIYGEIERLLNDRSEYYACLHYEEQGETKKNTSLNICREGDEYCFVWYDYDKDGFTAYYADGQYFYYDKATKEETVREADISEFAYYLEEINVATDYITTVYRDWYDGYCYKCAPWGFGWAQVYYHTDFTVLGKRIESMSGWWDIDHSVGFITNLEFNTDSIGITFNGSDSEGPVNKIADKKPIMKNTYENNKTEWFDFEDDGNDSGSQSY